MSGGGGSGGSGVNGPIYTVPTQKGDRIRTALEVLAVVFFGVVIALVMTLIEQLARNGWQLPTC